MTKHDYDVLQVVDALQQHDDSHRPTMKPNHEEMAKALSLMLKPLGPNSHKIALVPRDEPSTCTAYVAAGYEAHTVAREDKMRELMRLFQRTAHSNVQQPKHAVLVTEDPQLVMLCQTCWPTTQLSIWANSVTAHHELKHSQHYFQPLEELLPSLKIPQIDVRIDLENIFIGLVNRGWRPNMRELIGAIHGALEKETHGEVVSTTGYADYDELNRHHGSRDVNWQRELTLAGVESRYVVNQHGKNTADMRLASDISSLVEHSGTAGVIDIIGLATMDRDFRHVVEKVKQRGKKVVIVGLRGGLSRELEAIASSVCYLDDCLNMPRPGTKREVKPQCEDAACMMRIAAWMHENRWRFVYRDRLERQFVENAERLQKLVREGWLTPCASDPRSLEVNASHTAARAAHYLARWIPSRVDYCLNRKGLPFVDSNYIANGMLRDDVLVQMGVAQTRAEAEEWLSNAASAGLVLSRKRAHAQHAGRQITTWELPVQQSAEAPKQVMDGISLEQKPAAVEINTGTTQAASSTLRNLLTNGLSDAELTTLLYDAFTTVYRQVGSAPKHVRIQALLEYAELHGESDKLLAGIRELNPALFLTGQTEQLAA